MVRSTPDDFPNLRSYDFRLSAGVTNIILSMPHRGRLNLLTDLLQLPPRALFAKVRGGSEIPLDILEEGVSGDVISHLGAFLLYGQT